MICLASSIAPRSKQSHSASARVIHESSHCRQHSESVGRYAVVAADVATIRPNEVVLSEPAFALVPVYTTVAGNSAAGVAPKCSNCADWRTSDALRCAGCARISYCSERCANAVPPSRAHAFECIGHRMGLFGGALGVSQLAVRTLLLGAADLAAVCNGAVGGLDAVWTELTGAEPESKSSTDYARVLRLMTNYAKTAADDRMRYALVRLIRGIALPQCNQLIMCSIHCRRPPCSPCT